VGPPYGALFKVTPPPTSGFRTPDFWVVVRHFAPRLGLRTSDFGLGDLPPRTRSGEVARATSPQPQPAGFMPRLRTDQAKMGRPTTGPWTLNILHTSATHTLLWNDSRDCGRAVPVRPQSSEPLVRFGLESPLANGVARSLERPHQTSFVLAQATLERLKRLRSCRARTTAVFRAVGDLGLKIRWLRVW